MSVSSSVNSEEKLPTSSLFEISGLNGAFTYKENTYHIISLPFDLTQG
jgi:hypothetical protein